MADLEQLSRAMLARAVGALPDPGWWAAQLWYKPRPITTTPLVCIRSDPAGWGDFQQAMSGWTKWRLRVAFYLPPTDQDGSRERLGPLLGPTGALVRAMTDEDIRDDLYDLCRNNVQPTTGMGWDVIREERSRYLFADTGFELGSN